MADDAPKTRRKPRLGIIIRLAIYVPLLGFFGWRAWERFDNEREAADEVFRERVGQWLEHPPQTMVLPNGEALPMLTPEQAEAQGYRLPASFKSAPEGEAEPKPEAAPTEPGPEAAPPAADSPGAQPTPSEAAAAEPTAPAPTE